MWKLARRLGAAILVVVAARALPLPSSTPTDLAPGVPTDVIDHQLDERWIATIDGEGLPKDEFASWLIRRVGRQHVHEYVEMRLLRNRAKALDISLDRTEFDAHFQELWRRKIHDKYQTEEKLLLHLENLGYGKDDYRWEKAQEWERERLWRAIILAERSISEEELREMHRQRWGDESERWQLQLAFFDLGQRRRAGDTRAPDVTELKRRSADALRRGEEFASGLPYNESEFLAEARRLGDRLPAEAAALELLSKAPTTAGIEFEDYPRGLLEDAAELAIASLKQGETTPIIHGQKGLYLLRLIERTPLNFEQTRETLRAQRCLADPTPAENLQARKMLWGNVDVRRRY